MTYPDGCTQAMHDAAYAPSGDENAWQAACESAGEQAWDDWLAGKETSLASYCNDYCGDYLTPARIANLCAGGNRADVERERLRGDVVAYVGRVAMDEEIKEFA